MMESCLAGDPDRGLPIEVEDIKKNLLDEFALDNDRSQTENLQVYLRVRPFTAGESDSGESQDCVTIEGSDTVVLKPPRICQSNRQGEKPLPQTAQRFTFTQVFGPEASQREVFKGSVRSLVRGVLLGGNSLVFTYGVTNAGKTFTFLGPDHDSGLLPRSLSIIFNSIEGRLYGLSDLKPQRCRDFTRLTPDQQLAEANSKKNLLRMFRENDKTVAAGKSASFEGSSLSSDSSLNGVSEADSFCLDVSSNVCFSVWVSFCEIYNESIHDLLEQVPSGQHKRTVLRLSQDIKGNSFIKDLRWVQVNSSEEAYRIMKIGRKNQSCFSTKLNQMSSRSHSIFSVRVLRIADVGVPRVLGISELVLCDLAGSERCSRTRNTGVRLKEAGNINSSLLTLGKCINAMRLNQNAKFQHHVPFRESKLTHFLQFFFCGAGRVSMVVNVNQNSSSFDETLNVLKFSALAQKVVVMSSQPTVLDDTNNSSMSVIVDEAEQRGNVLGRSRRSSLLAWETSLEDVQEDGEEEEEEEEETTGPVAALRLVLEAQIRKEVSAEFTELFNKMERDYSERLEREREILEERSDRRVEILKNLISQTVDLPAVSKEEKTAFINSITEDLQKIREGAESVQLCLTEDSHHMLELETLRLEKQQSHDQLQEALKDLQLQQQKVSDLTRVRQQKDDVIKKLQEALEIATTERDATCSCRRRTRGEEEESRKRHRDDGEEQTGGAAKRKVLLEEIWRLQEETKKKEEIINELRKREELRRGQEEEPKRRAEKLRSREEEVISREQEARGREEELRRLGEELNERASKLRGQEEELKRRADKLRSREQEVISREQEARGREEEVISQVQESRGREEELRRLGEELNGRADKLRGQEEELKGRAEKLRGTEEELRRWEEELRGQEEKMEQLKEENMKENMQKLTDLHDCPNCDSVLSSLEVEQKETARLQKENKALVNGIFQLQKEATDLQTELKLQTDRYDSLSEQLSRSKSRLLDLENQLGEKKTSMKSLTEEVDRLKQEVKKEEGRSLSSSSVFHATMEELKKESQAALQRSAQKSEQIEELQIERRRLEESLASSQSRCEELSQELANQKAELTQQLQNLRAELESEGGALRHRLEEMKRAERERRKELSELSGMVSEKEELLEESRELAETLRQELQRLKENLLRSEEKENRGVKARRGRTLQGKEEEPNTQDVCPSPLRSNKTQKKRVPKSQSRKRKSSEVEGLSFSENKKDRENSRRQDQRDRSLQMIEELIQDSPSVLSSAAKTVPPPVRERSTMEEAVTKPRRGRRKLFKMDASATLLDSPHTTSGEAEDDKESDHLIIRRQLRSKTCRK
ncbi:kinesin-like protein KIF20B isoform X2 [Austrofundulus limnaeus]|uniref:Kinesin-like protein KIF20B isoform X2 n=1 Tax=Austrofundulus limnaeus TaxID=52670 RepID=A0A2I4CFL8_AUSLI|nr:PREDICTED: kinesin-like protein KIF20B isoform X2 [Austrofundulus limnaeus]